MSFLLLISSFLPPFLSAFRFLKSAKNLTTSYRGMGWIIKLSIILFKCFATSLVDPLVVYPPGVLIVDYLFPSSLPSPSPSR